MNKIFLFIVLISSNLIFSQVSNKFQKDESGNIVHSKVFDFESYPKDKLYSFVKVYFAEIFKSSNDVIQLDDKENGIILGKGITHFNVRSGKYDFKCKMSFTLKVLVKDNKCKIDVYNIVYNDSFPAEKFYSKEVDERYSKAKEKQKIIMDDYVNGTLNFFEYLDNSLIKIVKDKKSTDW